MVRLRPILWMFTLSSLLTWGAAAREGPDPGALAGKILAAQGPIPTASVYAYEIADFSFQKVLTDPEGNFLFRPLPAGLYKIIAFKSGFLPAVVMLTRATGETQQFLELELAPEPRGEGTATDFWSLRAQIPPDVLRDIQIGEESLAFTTESQDSAMPRFRTEMLAMAGFDQTFEMGDAQVAGGRVGVDGRLGAFQVGISGNFWQLEGASGRLVEAASGQKSAISIQLESDTAARLNVSSHSNRLAWASDGLGSPVDLEAYRVSWSRPIGEAGQSSFTAQYVTESNYYRLGRFEPLEIPEASRTLRLEGSYTTSVVDDRATLQTGVRYREREAVYDDPGALSPVLDRTAAERLDLFGRGGWRLQPTFLVEYGLYTTLRDGQVSLAPRGGFVVQLGSGWEASTLFSYQLQDDAEEQRRDFIAAFYGEAGSCEHGERNCYKVVFSRKLHDDETFAVGAVHREFGEVVRLYFSRDFFQRAESLYLVQGDRLPEIFFTVTRRLAPQVLTRIESNVAAGGGGIFQASNREPYENQIRYLVTSVETQFEATSTGVFVAFHHLEQEMNPLSLASGGTPALELDRLQLMLTQDLRFLFDLATNWALQLNFEISRGSLPMSSLPNEELRKKILGGVAVKF